MDLRNLSEKHRLIITVSVFALAIAGLGYWIFSSNKQYKAAVVENDTVKQQIVDIESKIVSAAQFKTELGIDKNGTHVKTGLREMLNRYLPPRNGRDEFIGENTFNSMFTIFNNALQKSELNYQTISFQLLTAETVPLSTIGVKFSGLSGNLNQIGTFVESLENMKPFVRIDNIVNIISKYSGTTVAKEVPYVRHTFDLTLSFFMYNEEKVPQVTDEKKLPPNNTALLLPYFSAEERKLIEGGGKESPRPWNDDRLGAVLAPSGQLGAILMYTLSKLDNETKIQAEIEQKKLKKLFTPKEKWEDVFLPAEYRLQYISDERRRAKLANEIEIFFKGDELVKCRNEKNMPECLKLYTDELWARREAAKRADLTRMLKDFTTCLPSDTEKYGEFLEYDPSLNKLLDELEARNGLNPSAFSYTVSQQLGELRKRIEEFRVNGEVAREKQIFADLQRKVAEIHSNKELSGLEKHKRLCALADNFKTDLEKYAAAKQFLDGEIQKIKASIRDESIQDADVRLQQALGPVEELLERDPSKVSDMVDNSMSGIDPDLLDLPQLKSKADKLLAFKTLANVESYYKQRLKDIEGRIRISGFIRDESGVMIDLGSGIIKQGTDLESILGDAGRGITIHRAKLLGNSAILVELEMNGRIHPIQIKTGE